MDKELQQAIDGQLARQSAIELMFVGLALAVAEKGRASIERASKWRE